MLYAVFSLGANMADTKPYIGSSVERLVKLINNDNDTNWVLGTHFEFGPVEDFSDNKGRNTQVLMKPLPAAGRRTQSLVKYSRLDLNVLAALPAGFIKSIEVQSLPFSIHNYMDEINEALGLSLTPDEVVNTTYSQKQERYPLTIATGSMAWLDGTAFDIRVYFPGDPKDVIEEITDTGLDGLVYP